MVMLLMQMVHFSVERVLGACPGVNESSVWPSAACRATAVKLKLAFDRTLTSLSVRSMSLVTFSVAVEGTDRQLTGMPLEVTRLTAATLFVCTVNKVRVAVAFYCLRYRSNVCLCPGPF